MNAGDRIPAVYPLASKVFLIPLGKLEASGSCCTNCALQISTGSLPSYDVSKKASCFQQLLQSMVETSVCNELLQKAHSFIPIAI
jgi:hypothetical protein